MKIFSKVITFSVDFTVAIVLVIMACFEETFILDHDMKVVLIFIGMLSLISSMITLISLSIDIYNEKKPEENKDDERKDN